MDIEEFIEQDILVFLDAELDNPEEKQAQPAVMESAFLTRDYEEEFLKALDENDGFKAKKILHDLKQKFDDIPTGAPEKQQFRYILTDLYEKFKDHLDSQRTFERLDEGLTHMRLDDDDLVSQDPAEPTGEDTHEKELDKPPIPKMPEKKIPAVKKPKPVLKPKKELPKKKIPFRRPAKPPAKTPLQKEREKLIAHANTLLDKIEQTVAEGQVKKAMQLYRTVRRDALAMDKVPSKIALRFTTVFNEMRELMQYEKMAEVDRSVILNLEREKLTLSGHLRADNVAGAMRSYKSMCTLARQLHDKKIAKETAQKIATVHQIIKGHARKLQRRKETQRSQDKRTREKNLDKEALLQLEREKHALDDQLRNDDAVGAMQTYRRMRVLSQQITGTAVAESAAKKLVKIYTIISKIKDHAAHNDRSLMRATP